MDTPLQIIAARRREIAAEKADHLTALESLDAETAELDVTERTLARLMGNHRVDFGGLDLPLNPNALTQNGKPPNTPTVPEMILELLGGRSQHGMDGLDSKGLTQLIGEKWWSGVTTSEINPIAWRMAKRGQLIKDGARYRLPRNALMDPPPPEGDDPPDDA
jgi:hypothetical protein